MANDVQRKQMMNLLFPNAMRRRSVAGLMTAFLCLAACTPGYGQQMPNGTLSEAQFAQFGSTIGFDISLVRLYPAILDNPEFMRYFVALNNCTSPQIEQLINNELDFPRAAANYKDRAAQITASMPPVVSIGLYGGQTAHGDDRMMETARLGDYDVQRSAFPIITHQGLSDLHSGSASSSKQPADPSATVSLSSLKSIFGKKNKTDSTDSGKAAANEHHVIQIDGNNLGIASVRDNLTQPCPAANHIVHLSGQRYGILPHDYAVRTESTGFDEVPMPESAAREYINKHPPSQRAVMFAVFVRITDQAPKVEEVRNRTDHSVSYAEFAGKIAKVDVVDQQTGAVIATLMDDHSVPSSMDTPKEKPVAPAGPESAVFMANLAKMPVGSVKFKYSSLKKMPSLQTSIDYAVAVAMDHDFCKWPIGPREQHNVSDFLNDIQNDPEHKARIGVAADRVQHVMDVFGGNYCNNFQEKEKYSLMMGQMWPTGRLANPDAF